MHYLAIGVRCLIGTVFVVSFIGKFTARGALADLVGSLRELRLLPENRVRTAARLLTTAEGGIAALLIAPSSTLAGLGLGAAALLLTVFAAGIGIAARRGAHAVCACFGPSQVPLGRRHVVRNALLAAVAVTGIAASASTSPVSPGPAVVAAVSGLLTGVLITRLDDLFDLLFPSAGPTGR
ncbi:MauE/DoxX family redox-associated membrane protein [Streptomyces sp. NPDC059786]|uniref:MauE/DoxX family redox-associated membrane protein n=1 Tax=Streptomyces sp. NPDC059786 TaxID=3346946 RepID=UPI00364990BF